MTACYNRFVHDENLRDWHRRLQTEADPQKRRLLETLVSEETAHRLPRPRADADSEDEQLSEWIAQIRRRRLG